MVTTNKTVKMGKGDKGKVIPFTYERPVQWDECVKAFEIAMGKGQIGEKLTPTEVFCYGFELKIRAKIQGANGDEAGKVQRRNDTVAWVMTPGSGGEEFKPDVLAGLTGGNVKAHNEYLDELYAAEEAAILEWKAGK